MLPLAGGAAATTLYPNFSASFVQVGIHNTSAAPRAVAMQQPQVSLDTTGGALRVRKPYTITKAREKWTSEEHARFVEAIKLFGRSWKKIEGGVPADGTWPDD